MKSLILAFFFFSLPAHSAMPRERFFANPALQQERPAAFALQSEALAFLREARESTEAEALRLVAAVRAQPALLSAIENWKFLAPAARESVLREVFALEVAVMGTEAPELVIGKGATPNGAFFEFDLNRPGSGKVLLSPEKLDDSNYESLAFLIHETRHSSQLQRAFGFEKEKHPALSAGYLEAFQAQKNLGGRLGFCDFLTLLNEVEAFTFGNLVVSQLTKNDFEQVGMGTFASQLLPGGGLKIDLLRLHEELPDVLAEFNRLEEPQFEHFNRP